MVRFCAMLVSSMLFAGSAYAGDELYYSAMDLAIEHFNADGSKELKAWGPEHTVMIKALEAVAKKVPQVASASKMSAFGAEKRFSSLALTIRKPDLKTSSVATVMRSVETLVDGCGYRRETKTDEQDLGYSEPSVKTQVTTIYDLGGTGKKKCTSPSAPVLLKFGLNQVLVRDTNGDVEFAIQAGGSTVQDMRYVKSVLMQSGLVDSRLITVLDPPPVRGVIGASSDITLLNSTGKAALTDAFALKYFIGSGDCMAGCIDKTYITVEVQPTTGVGTRDPKFKIDVL